ncbi:MAG: radical SAM protein [Planctomycetota bacterium]
MKFTVVNVVWGREYTRFFTDVSLPTTLAPGNLPSVREYGETVYRLYTTAPDFQWLMATPNFQRLARLMPLEVAMLHGVATKNKYVVMKEAHDDAIRTFADGEHALIFLCPDLLVSDGALRFVAQAAAHGKRAVLVCGLHLETESALPDLLAQHKPTVSGRELVALALKHPDAFINTHMWGEDAISPWPHPLFWRVGDEGLLAHCAHVHPLLVWPRKGTVPPLLMIDSTFVRAVCEGEHEAAVVTDSDDVCLAEFRSGRTELYKNVNTLEYLRTWVSRYMSDQHLWCFRHPIRFHSGSIGPEWQAVEQQAASVVQAIVGEVEEPRPVGGPPRSAGSAAINSNAFGDFIKKHGPPFGSVFLQLTAHCSLRCRYCTQGKIQVGGKGDMEPWLREYLQREILKGIPHVALGLFGETLCARWWSSWAKPLLDAGVAMDLTNTNAALPFSDEDLQAMLRLKRVAISIDSPKDTTMLKWRGAKVKTVVENTRRLLALKKKADDCPNVSWAAVWTAGMIEEFIELVHLAKECGVREIGVQAFMPFIELDDPSGAPFMLEGQEFIEAFHTLKRAQTLAESLGVCLGLPQPDIMNALYERALGRPQARLAYVQTPNIQGHAEHWAIPLRAGETRECCLPWVAPCITSDGTVYPCCFSGEVMGKVTPETSLTDVYFGKKYSQFRIALLSGHGPATCCRQCIITPIKKIAWAYTPLGLKPDSLNQDYSPQRTQSGQRIE